MFQKFFEHLINKVYQDFCQLFSLTPQIWKRFPHASSQIRFGGWELSYNWKGKVDLTHDLVGDIRILYKTIYFNHRYFLCLLNSSGGDEFSFDHFVQTFAHEIAHCLLLDHETSFKICLHGTEHILLTEVIRQYCERMSEFQILYRCQIEKREFLC